MWITKWLKTKVALVSKRWPMEMEIILKKKTRIIAQWRQFSFSLVAYGRRFQHGEALQKISGWCH